MLDDCVVKKKKKKKEKKKVKEYNQFASDSDGSYDNQVFD
jgi:hypothetical protein